MSLRRCDSYDPDRIEECLSIGFNDLGGIEQFFKKGDKVLLKANLLSPSKAEKASVTHPQFIRAVIRIIKKVGASCFVGDSPAVNSVDTVAKMSGIKQMCEQESVSLIDLKTPIQVDTPQGRIAKTITIADELSKFDKIINLPKLKNHGLTQITVAAKNLYGVIPGLRKSEYHFRYKDINQFNSMLIELNQIVQPDLNIVDGIVGMEGDGPMSGDPRNADVIIMGDNTMAVDYVAASVMNYQPENIPIFNTAKEYDFGGYQKEMINVLGEDLESCIIKDFKTIKGSTSPEMFPKPLQWIISHFMVKKPLIKHPKCIGCGKCVKICPAKTIKLNRKKAYITYKNCINCYCCSEICPYKAIQLIINPFV